MTTTEQESRLGDDGRDRYVITTVPGMGLACITSGVGFYAVRWGARYVNSTSDQDTAAPVVNGKTYAMLEATITYDGAPFKMGLVRSFWGADPTPAAAKKVRAAVDAWAPTWVQSDEARQLRRLTIDEHNRINASTLADEITNTTRHLAELKAKARAIKAQAGKADPTYVDRYTGLTYRLQRAGD